MNTEFKRGILTALPLMIGFIPLSMILGAQASQVGQSFLTAYMMTALNFAGGSEFAVLGIWSTVPPVLLVVFSTFLINSRHIIMGATLAPYIRNESPLRIVFIYFVMCDETWALSMQEIQRRELEKQSNVFSFYYHMGIGFGLWLFWSLFTAIGAIVGTIFTDMNAWGFAIALPATFIGLSVAMRPREDNIRYIPIAISFIASALTSIYLSSSYAVGIGAIAGLLSAFIIFEIKHKNMKDECNRDLEQMRNNQETTKSNVQAPLQDKNQSNNKQQHVEKDIAQGINTQAALDTASSINQVALQNQAASSNLNSTLGYEDNAQHKANNILSSDIKQEA